MMTEQETSEAFRECRSAARQTLEVITDLILDRRGDVPPALDEAQNSARGVLDSITEAELAIQQNNADPES